MDLPATVEVGSPAHVVADRSGPVFVSRSGNNNEIAVADLRRAEVITRVATGAYPHGPRLSPDDAELYVANVDGGSVSVIDMHSLTEAVPMPVGEASVQVAFTLSGDRTAPAT